MDSSTDSQNARKFLARFLVGVTYPLQKALDPSKIAFWREIGGY